MSLLDHLWQSTLCAAAAALLALLVRRSPARWRHGIWLAASVKFLLPLWMLVAAGSYAGDWARELLPLPVPAAARWLGESRAFRAIATPRDAITLGPLADRVIAGLAFVWLAGTAAFVAWRWQQRRDLAAIIRHGTPIAHGREAAALHRVTAGFPPARVDLRQCGAGVEPGIAGIRRPTLLWPQGLSDRLSDAEMEAILQHELRHVVRRDNLCATIHTVVETAFWFHPLVWYIGARLAHERERACDEEVVRMNVDRETYARSIVKVCSFCLRGPSAVMGVGSSDLARRIERILDAPRLSPPGLATRLVLALVVSIVVGTPLAAGAIRIQEQARESESRPERPAKNVTPPRVVYEVKAKYTKEAMAERIQGRVVLDVVVLESGGVGDVTVTQSLDPEYGLDEQAVVAAKQWRFDPATKDGKPVAVTVEMEMVFRLK